MNAPSGSRFSIGTEGSFVRNLVAGGGCATLSRNDPPHLAGMLDLLRKGAPPDPNLVLPGDIVSETTGVRDRLAESERAELVAHARSAMRRMIAITEAADRGANA